MASFIQPPCPHTRTGAAGRARRPGHQSAPSNPSSGSSACAEDDGVWAWRTNETDGAVRPGRFARTNPRCRTSTPSSWPATEPAIQSAVGPRPNLTNEPEPHRKCTNEPDRATPPHVFLRAGGGSTAGERPKVDPRSNREMTEKAMDTNEPDARRTMHERTRAVVPPPSRRMTAWAFCTNEPETDDQTAAPPTLDGRLEAGHDEAGMRRAHDFHERTGATPEIHERTRASRPPQHERTRDHPPTPLRHGRPQSRPSRPTTPRERHRSTRTNPSTPDRHPPT